MSFEKRFQVERNKRRTGLALLRDLIERLHKRLLVVERKIEELSKKEQDE